MKLNGGGLTLLICFIGVAVETAAPACSVNCSVGCDIRGSGNCDQCDPGYVITANRTCQRTQLSILSNWTKTYACDGNELKITCRLTERIQIVYATYSSITNDLCYTNAQMYGLCLSNNSLAIVQRLCSEKSNCAVNATKTVFGGPCPSVPQHLDVIHQCYSDSQVDTPLTVYDCEDSALTIVCKQNERIVVEYANYGRLSNDFCASRENFASNNIECIATNSLSIVRNLCSGVSNCTISITNGVFGDPCTFTGKYLAVTYRCSSGSVSYPPNSTYSTFNSGSAITSTMAASQVREVSNKAFAIGLGVGIPLGLILLVLVVVILIRCLRKSKKGTENKARIAASQNVTVQPSLNLYEQLNRQQDVQPEYAIINRNDAFSATEADKTDYYENPLG